jgi:hypothetical protein
MSLDHHQETANERAAAEEKKGIECRRCGCRHFSTIYTRACVKGIRRRRECRHCGLRTTTYERNS